MKNSAFLLLVLGILTCPLQAQGVKISPQPGTPDPSAILETQDSTRGVLMPRVNLQNLTDAVTIANPATSLMVFNTGTTLAPAGFYYNAGTPQAPQWALVLPNPANTNLNMNGFAIENLATPVNPADAVTKDYVDNQIINVSGSGGGSCQCPTMLSTESVSAVSLATAARNCSALVESGHSDWYLPLVEDIMVILSKDASSISNNTSSTFLWTRTMAPNSSTAFTVFRLSDGGISGNSSQSAINYYRCAR
jgi:hypothetical protein